MRDFPKRLSPSAPYGALLKRASDQPQRHAMKAYHPEGGADYLALVRRLPCLYCGVEPCGEAAHVKFACASFGMSNMLGKRVDDSRALPLCRDDHQNARHAQHKGNERAFWEALGVNAYPVTQRLYERRFDFVAMYYVIVEAIAERSKKRA